MDHASTLETLLRDLSRSSTIGLDKVRLKAISDIVQGMIQDRDRVIQAQHQINTLRIEVRHLEQTLRNEGILVSQYRVSPDTPTPGEKRGNETKTGRPNHQ